MSGRWRRCVDLPRRSLQPFSNRATSRPKPRYYDGWVRVSELSGSIGARIEELDLEAPVSEATQDELRRLLATHHLLLFHADDLSPGGQIGLLECFGRVLDERGDGARHVFVSNNRPDGVLGFGQRLLFHSDCTFADPPISVLSLYALEVPDHPSPTLFANGSEALRRLSPELRGRLEGQRGLFLSGFGGGYERYFEDSAPPDSPRAVHPVVYDDPVSGRQVLMIDEMMMDRIVGWERADSEAARQEAHRCLYASDNLYAHHWQVGDLVVWNNIVLQHGRPELPESGARTLRRVATVQPDTSSYAAWTAHSLEKEAALRQAG
jgi:taurine dioxygenase